MWADLWKYIKKGFNFGINYELILLLSYSLFWSKEVETKTKFAYLALLGLYRYVN